MENASTGNQERSARPRVLVVDDDIQTGGRLEQIDPGRGQIIPTQHIEHETSLTLY